MVSGRPSRPFDVWTMSSTGHQQSDSRPGTGWRDARDRALNRQFGAVGGVSAAARHGEGPKAAVSVAQMLRRPGLMAKHEAARQAMAKEGRIGAENKDETTSPTERVGTDREQDEPQDKPRPRESIAAENKDDEHKSETSRLQVQEPTRILAGVVAYINGCTNPHISDYRLRLLLAQHGAHSALHLARRRVTHVILGQPAAPSAGAGGGLAAAKLQREIRRSSGSAVKYVGVEWVLESIKAGKRLPEARFAIVPTGGARQPSVYQLYAPKRP
ncbi:hypothetical protein CDD82_4858 [Ophiocordyceps australis]|uniref:BRCT domain-containing protein n=1 Tax=Ophiocordyceps australis TaxID=1399860 RepID=A0A2C5ZTM4_9HYPO|nr:hypothetical protein CDD82_4858 [Ophiocordyceps australis]